jgi:hypothetical protein
MEDLKSQIQQESSLAANCARQARTAFALNNLARGGELMQQAHAHGRRCQQLIQQCQPLSSTTKSK